MNLIFLTIYTKIICNKIIYKLLILIVLNTVIQTNALITKRLPILLPSGEDPNNKVQEQRQLVKQMMEHAWNSYSKYAWGKGKYFSLSMKGSPIGIKGLSIVNSLSTLLIMNMSDEFRSARDWIETNLDICSLNKDVSVSKVVNKIVGPLLSAFVFTYDTMFLNKAKNVTDCILPVFNNKTGIASDVINPLRAEAKDPYSCSHLSKFGSLHLEFVYLSATTGDTKYAERMAKMRHFINNMTITNDGLYYKCLDRESGVWNQRVVDIGSFGNGFFKYLLRSWIQSNFTDTEAQHMFYKGIEAIDRKLVHRSRSGLTHLKYQIEDELYEEMTQKICSTGGLFAQGSLYEENEQLKTYYLELGINLTYTCQEIFRRAPTGLAPRWVKFNKEGEPIPHNVVSYDLSSETIESYFYLWRITHDQRYRDYAWSVTLAINKYCRIDTGFAGIIDTSNTKSGKIDSQPTYFMAETLKYLYLIFSSDDLIPLKDWVITNGGHPLPNSSRDRNKIEGNVTVKHRVEESTELMDSTTEIDSNPTQRG